MRVKSYLKFVLSYSLFYSLNIKCTYFLTISLQIVITSMQHHIAESIEWYIESQAFMRVVKFGSSHTPFPLSRRKLSLFLSLPICLTSSLLNGEGGGGRRGAESYDPRESLALYKLFRTLWHIANMRFIVAKNLQDKFVDCIYYTANEGPVRININVWHRFIYSQKWNCAASLFPKQNYNVLSPNFHIHVFVSYVYISRIGMPI